ncbi:hypothetical protein DB313_05275 (plasmid) [Borrelia turcica IST7]|uniref:Uncharacterized protein n=2 Tax=Borrelia turcica TaxID=229155 RepID=A0A386PNS2_9SPIR|nr:hypothetical protein DB313_05275 [Borrelia turcica IST7]
MSEVRLTEKDKIELEDTLKTLRELRKSKIILPEEYKIELKNKVKDDIIKICEYLEEDDRKFEEYKEKHGAGRDEDELYEAWHSKPYPRKIDNLIEKNISEIREYWEEKYPEVDCSTRGDLNSEWFCWYNFLYKKLGMAWLRGE